MWMKLIGLIKAILYGLKYGHKITFHGIPAMDIDAKVNIKQGKMIVEKKFSAKSRVYFAVVHNGVLRISENVSFGRNCITVCHESITIGQHVYIGPNVFIYDHDHKFNVNGITKGYRTSPVSIGNNCWIGAGVIILRGTTIGDGCVIGAGCVVKGNIPPYSLVTMNRELNIEPLEDKSEVR